LSKDDIAGRFPEIGECFNLMAEVPEERYIEKLAL